MARNVYVTCGECRGSGRIAHPGLTETLKAVPSGPRWSSTSQIAKLLGIGATNAANLLRRLHETAYIERRGAGAGRSPYEWSRP